MKRSRDDQAVHPIAPQGEAAGIIVSPSASTAAQTGSTQRSNGTGLGAVRLAIEQMKLRSTYIRWAAEDHAA